MHAADTNILLYAIDPRDPRKQRIAREVIESLEEPVLLWQVGIEYLAVSRKFETVGISRAHSWDEIERLRVIWPTLYPAWSSVDKARELLGRYSFSFWDALIVASCLTGGVSRLYSEDFDAYAEIDGLEIRQPFREPR